MKPEKDGWHYAQSPSKNGDCRKLVTLLQDGMTWVGVRAYHHEGQFWMNNGEPSSEEVKAWRDLPEPAAGFYDRGQLTWTLE